jgi:hypothetical protein
MPEKDPHSDRIRRLTAWAHTPAGLWILFALSLIAVSLIIALLS